MCDSWDIDISFINKTILEIDKYIEFRHNHSFCKSVFNNILNNIALVLIEWTGKTYVGEQKQLEVKQAFQQFFIVTVRLINFIDKEKVKISLLEKRFAKSFKYTGKIYRYLGSNIPDNRKIIVDYNDIFVSWSKNKQSSYLENKLYGIIIRLYCEIPDDKFGIDLGGFQNFYNLHSFKHCYIARGEECEVVFPTIKETIYKIEYLQET